MEQINSIRKKLILHVQFDRTWFATIEMCVHDTNYHWKKKLGKIKA